MKKITFITLIIISLVNFLQAQETVKKLGSGEFISTTDTGNIYYKDTQNYMTKYLGTWLYNNGTTYFKITFIKSERVRMGPTNTYYDEINCEYLLKINGDIIYDSYGVNSNIDNGNIYNHISGSGVYYDANPNKIDLFYSEPALNGGCHRYAHGNLLLEYLNSSNNEQLLWTRTNAQLYGDTTDCSNGTQMDTSEFLIPANMVLTKQ